MDELRSVADNHFWHDGERSRGQYCCPIPATPWKAGIWTLRDWKSLAARHVVNDGKVKPYTLIEGVPAEHLYELNGIWCAKSPESHIGPFLHAIDFLVPDGTPVLAAQCGRVVRFVDGNDEWGDGPGFRDKVNYIDISHSYDETTEYCHLAKSSVRALGIKPGDWVEQGQVIGVVGKTGWTDRDHLHFVVLRDDSHNPANPLAGRKYKSLLVRFV